ncbi:MAG: DEAD/DEAH box helicase [Telmatospirillum sp.]|nr:DEAD/DEAH box helicase [Telmatospirillum sp.]
MVFFPAGHPLTQALTDRQYTEPTDVQQAVLSADAADRDLLVSARTGSGKTVAYGLAMARTLLSDAGHLPPAGNPLALIVAPTRELALQVRDELSWLYSHTGARIASCVGGMDPRAEQRRLSAGAHIVVGTPGRLCDHLARGALVVSDLAVLVLDEADEMLDLGFREDLETLLDAAPENRRTLLFSATLPAPIVSLASRYQQDAMRIAVDAGVRGHEDISYQAIRITPGDEGRAVVNVLRFVDAPSAIVFCNTRDAVRDLQADLQDRGFNAVGLSGEMGQSERNQALKALRDGHARVCVATDVAARGIDLPNLGLVIHAELPRDAAALQHRSGRTGRAGRKGVSILLVPASRRRKAERLLGEAGVHATWSGAPTAAEIDRQDRERLFSALAPGEEISEADRATARELLERCPAEDIAAALVRLYRDRLPTPADLTDPGDPARRERRPANGDRANAGRDDWKRGDDRKREWEPSSRPARDRGFQSDGQSGPGPWFSLPIGRQKRADPRWLIPVICRQGGITKQEIGKIRIFEKETRFEIAPSVADRFREALARAERPEIRIEPSEPAPHPARVAAPGGKPSKSRREGQPDRKARTRRAA